MGTFSVWTRYIILYFHQEFLIGIHGIWILTQVDRIGSNIWDLNHNLSTPLSDLWGITGVMMMLCRFCHIFPLLSMIVFKP